MNTVRQSGSSVDMFGKGWKIENGDYITLMEFCKGFLEIAIVGTVILPGHGNFIAVVPGAVTGSTWWNNVGKVMYDIAFGKQ